MFTLFRPRATASCNSFITFLILLFSALQMQSQTITESCALITQITTDNSGNLPAMLQNDVNLRNDYINAHDNLKASVLSLPEGDAGRQEIYDCYKNLINNFPNLYQKQFSYNSVTQNYMAWIRERAHRTFADALELTPQVKFDIASVLDLNSFYLDAWNDFNLLIADNYSLELNQGQYIYSLFSQVPPELHDMRLFGFSEFLGMPPVPNFGAIITYLEGSGSSYNGFTTQIGTFPENQFPMDGPMGVTDVFCATIAHELNHVVENFTVNPDPTFESRRLALLAQAGNDSLNYLRSMFAPGFFADNPQEFFASIANQYITDTRKTFELAKIRLNAGLGQPMNQFLFFADVYSSGRTSTIFYTMDENCNLSSERVSIQRTDSGAISRMCIDDVTYFFTLGTNDNVESIASLALPCTPTSYITCPVGGTIECGADAIAGMISIDTICTTEGVNITVDGPNIDGIPNCPGTTYTFTFMAIDSCDNMDNCFQEFVIQNDGPEITSCPPSVDVMCESDVLAGTPDYTFSCGLTIDLEVSDPMLIGEANCPNAVYRIDYTVTDACGRSDNCFQNFTIIDGNDPDITECPQDQTVSCLADIVTGTPVYTTDCGVSAIVRVSSPVVDGDANCPGTTYTYTYSVQDICGRVSTCRQVFTIQNDGLEIDECPMDQSVVCKSDIVLGVPSFTSSCGVNANSTVMGPVVDGTDDCPGTTYSYTYMVIDDCGGTASCTQIFTISAGNGPAINSCPEDQIVSCAADIITAKPDYTTECGLGSGIVISEPVINGDPGCDGTTYTFTYTITDNCGRSASCDQVFTIQNNGPSLTECPADKIVACASEIQTSAPMFLTDCHLGATVNVTGPIVNGTANCPGTSYTYTYTVTDICGGVATCEQVFTIQNDEPIIFCPANKSVNCEADISVGLVNFKTSCGVGATVTKTGPVINGEPTCDGTTYTYTHTVTDACGRTVSCEQVFTIDNSCQRLDFDAYPAATIISSQYTGVHISTDDPHTYSMLFDTGNPTSNDFDLGTPNELYGGPGIGEGFGNTEFQGNALVVSKDSHVPNETEGQLIFDFDCAVLIRSMDFLDMECKHNSLSLFDEHNDLIRKINLPQYGENSFHVEEINIGGVYKMVVNFPCAGGGITDIKYCLDDTPEALCISCDQARLDFTDHGVEWDLDVLSGNYTVGYQNFDINISDSDNIFQDSEEDDAGILVAIDPNDVDDEVIITYMLSEVASRVVFDIEDLDYKNSGSMQQERVCVYGMLTGSGLGQILPELTSIDGSVDINGNCAEGTEDSAHTGKEESVLVTFNDCIDKIVIEYGTGSNSPTHNPTYSKISIGEEVGFITETCPGACTMCEYFGDADGDGVCDDIDMCLTGDNSIDADGDGLPDACDGDCATLGDDDMDGICNDADICPLGNDNIDLDQNGIPDACDDSCNEYTLKFSCQEEWADNAEDGSYMIGEQNFDINIMDPDNILVDTEQEGLGINVGIDPHDVDDLLMIKYSLSKVANNVMFDIVDLDYKDGASKQQEQVCVVGYLGDDPTEILPMITLIEGHVDIQGNCAIATQNSATSHMDESVMVMFNQCVDMIVIEYGTGPNSPTHDPSYSQITIGKDLGFKTKVCEQACCSAEGGDISGGPFTFCVGDGIADNIPLGAVTLINNDSENSQWVVTNSDGTTILGLPASPNDVDFDGAGAGTCLLWHLGYSGTLEGAFMNAPVNELSGCFDLSNPITINRYSNKGGILSGGPFSFCVGDGIADNIPNGAIQLIGATGESFQWVVTDESGSTILGLPNSPNDVDFDGAGMGECLIWNLSYSGNLTGAAIDGLVADLDGCFSLSNPIKVKRKQAEGGTITGGPFKFCVGDGIADNIPMGAVMLDGNVGESQWVVTDGTGTTILGLPNSPSDVDFDGAGDGTCLLWHLSYTGSLVGASMFAPVNGITGCFSLSNPIEIVREEPEGGELIGGPFTFCVGDNVADNIDPADVSLINNFGETSSWVITNYDADTILGLPNSLGDVDFDGASIDSCLIWNISYFGDISGLIMGGLVSDIDGCFDLSNNIKVVRESCGTMFAPDCQTEYSSAMGNYLDGIQMHAVHYQAVSKIESSQKIDPASEEVMYDSGGIIELHSNFEVRSGAVFHAFIDGCENKFRINNKK